jgi:hypothetical protein
MPVTLTIRDETTQNRNGQTFTLSFPAERLTVRELIRSRVYQEVEAYNSQQTEYFRGLVQPSEAEQTINGYKLLQGRQINGEAQFDKALQAFQRNGFLLLVDDRQLDDLDEIIELQPETEISFLKLIPLVGG